MTTVITGANRGIGRALYDLYAAEGRPLLGTTRASPAPDGFATLDVTDPADHRALAERLSGTPVSLLVCNAGIFIDRHEALEGGFAPDLWARSFATNVMGPFLTVQSLLGSLRAAPGARVAIIASQLGSSTRARGGAYIYKSTKAAAVNLARNLAVDLAPEGIAVGVYHPGWVRTDMTAHEGAISAEESAAGLARRFEALSLETTGVFETWDGETMPF